MTRSQRIAIWVLTLIGLLAAWKLFGQGFGNFRTDQPFLARNYSASGSTDLPNLAGLKYRWVAGDLVDGGVSGWTDQVQNVVIGQATVGYRPSKSGGGVYFANADATDVRSLTNINFPVFSPRSNAIMIVTSNTLPIYTAANNYGLFWGEYQFGYGIRLHSNSVGTVTWGWSANGAAAPSFTFANYGATMPQGIQVMLFLHLPNDGWQCYTNGVLSAVSTNSITANPLSALGRDQAWVNSSSFRGHIMELVIWSNSPSMTTQQITQAFSYATNKYGIPAP